MNTASSPDPLALGVLFYATFSSHVEAFEALAAAARAAHAAGEALGSVLGWVSVATPESFEVTLGKREYFEALARSTTRARRLSDKPWRHPDPADVLRIVIVTPYETASSTLSVSDIEENANARAF